MENEFEKIYDRLAKQDVEITNLRQGYMIVNKRYAESLVLLGKLTDHTLEATRRASNAARNASDAALHATKAATEAASQAVQDAANAAADAAAKSAIAATEAAASAAAASRQRHWLSHNMQRRPH